jgi:hypothetical protein
MILGFIEIGSPLEVSQDISGNLQANTLSLDPFVRGTMSSIAQDRSLNSHSIVHFFVP